MWRETMLDAALAVAARGWAVFPVHNFVVDPSGKRRCACMDSACKTPGKHPWARGGFKGATTETALVKKYWERWPQANIGVATGRISNLIVLDVDPRNGGDDTLADLVREHGSIPETVEVITGGGGAHYYFRYPDGGSCHSKNGAWKGIDLKADGGYVIAPPSAHLSGSDYEWEVSGDPFCDEEPAQVESLPAWVLERLTSRASAAEPETGLIGEGRRNNELASIAGTLRKRGCGETEITAAIRAVNEERCSPPLASPEVDAIAKSVCRYAPGGTSDVGGGTIIIQPPSGGAAGGNGKAPAAKARQYGPLEYPWTDTGNAELFADTFGDEWRYDHRRGKWMQWTDHWWRPDDGKVVWERAVATARLRRDAADAEPDPEVQESAKKFARQCENKSRLANMIEIATTLPTTKVVGRDWDADPWLLGAANGVVDLKTGGLRDGRRDDYITQHTPVEYDPRAKCPRFDQFLNEICGGDIALRQFLLRSIAYTITGSIREQCLFLCYGRGANGKSTLLNLLQALMGNDPLSGYAHTIDAAALQYSSGPTNQSASIAMIVGKRLVTAAELSVRRFDEQRLKALAGGDFISARFLYQESFQFKPVAKLWLSFNSRPTVRDDSHGFWRKVRLIPFTQVFDPTAEPDIEKTLHDELPGVLALVVGAVEDWREHGLNPPPVVLAETERYREESDHVTQFLSDTVVRVEGGRVECRVLYNSYIMWCDEGGISSKERLASNAFGRRMSEKYVRNRSSAARYYKDMEIRSAQNVFGADL